MTLNMLTFSISASEAIDLVTTTSFVALENVDNQENEPSANV